MSDKKPMFPYHYICSCGRKFSVGRNEYNQHGIDRILEHIRTCGGTMMACGDPSSPLPKVIYCPKCSGAGDEFWPNPNLCDQCNGTGHIIEDDQYIDFGDFSRSELGIQCQYGSYFVNGLAGHPRLCDDLRILNRDSANYHSMKIHRDDAPILKERVNAWRGG